MYRVQVEKGHGGHRGGLVAATPLVGTESNLAPSLILAVVLLVLHFDFDGLGRGIVRLQKSMNMILYPHFWI